MQIVRLNATKAANKDSITINSTQNGNYSITGTITHAKGIERLTTQGRLDIGPKLIGATGVVFFPTSDKKLLKEFQTLAKKHYAELAKNSDRSLSIVFVLQVGEVNPTNSGSVLISDIKSVTVEAGERVLDLDMFQANVDQQRYERNLNFSQRISKMFGRSKV